MLSFFTIKLFVLVFTYSVSSHAVTAENCKSLFDASLLQQAITQCTLVAEAGNSLVQTILGEIYDTQGNSQAAEFWWKQAADANHQPARNLLALKYYYGGSVFGPEKGWDQEKKHPPSKKVVLITPLKGGEKQPS